MATQRISGSDAESLARAHLEARGLKLIASNFASRCGEIDLIMRDQQTIVFVEVRYRNNAAYGTPLETVGQRKQKRLILAAQRFLQLQRLSNTPARFDVIGISPGQNSGELTFDWCQNAFGF